MSTDYEKFALDRIAKRIARRAKNEADKQIEEAVDSFCRAVPDDGFSHSKKDGARQLIDRDSLILHKINRIIGSLLDG